MAANLPGRHRAPSANWTEVSLLATSDARNARVFPDILGLLPPGFIGHVQPSPEQVRRAPYSPASRPVQNMRVDHRRLHIGMPQKLLHRPDVVSVASGATASWAARELSRWKANVRVGSPRDNHE